MCNPTRFVSRCVSLAKETVVGRPAPAVQRVAGGYAEWVMLSILCLKERKGETYRSVIGILHAMPRVCESFDMNPGTAPRSIDRV
jgi:hypothetical protein